MKEDRIGLQEFLAHMRMQCVRTCTMCVVCLQDCLLGIGSLKLFRTFRIVADGV